MLTQDLQKKLIQKAQSLHEGKILHLSFILDGNRIICYGRNYRNKTHPASPSKYRTTHSELHAILMYPIKDECKRYHIKNFYELSRKLTLVNVRLMADGSLGISKPCKYCQKLLNELQFSKVYYTTKEGFTTDACQ